MARGLNRVMGRNGRVFADRYHARSLRTPTEVRGAIVSVLGNARKHLPAIGRKPGADWIDPYSSAVATGPAPVRVLVAPPETWLLMTGSLRAAGRIRSEETPSGHSPPAAALSSAAARGALAARSVDRRPENARS